MLIVAIAFAGLPIGLAAALYLKRKGNRSDQEKRAKELSRALAQGTVADSTGASGSGGGDFDGDD